MCTGACTGSFGLLSRNRFAQYDRPSRAGVGDADYRGSPRHACARSGLVRQDRAKAASGSSRQQTPRVPGPLASSGFQPGHDEDLLGILGVLLGEGPRKKKKTRKPAPAEHKCKRCGEPFTRSPGSNKVCMNCHGWGTQSQPAPAKPRCKRCGKPFTRSPGSNTVCMTCHLWAAQSRQEQRQAAQAQNPSSRRHVGRCRACGQTAALRGQTCDACQIANGYLRCKDCAVLCPPALLDKHGSCQKCRGLRTPRTSSVRTVSGGLPTLGRRR